MRLGLSIITIADVNESPSAAVVLKAESRLNRRRIHAQSKLVQYPT